MSRHVMIWVAALALTALLAAPAGAELVFSGSLSNETRLRMLQNDMPDNYDWDWTMLMTTAQFAGRATDEMRTVRLVIDAQLRHDPTGIFAEDDDLEWRLNEAYGGFYSPYVSFQIGKIIYAWGMADEFNPTDLLNPEDLRWMTSFDKPERKLGVYSATMTLSYGNFALQGVAVPAFEPNILPAANSQWLPWELGLFYGLLDTFPDYVDFQADQRPALTLGNTDYALRFTGTLGGFDLLAVYYDGHDHLPYYQIAVDPDVNQFLAGGMPLTVREAYQRYQAIGGGLGFTAGDFAFRTEGAYYTNRTYNNGIDEELLTVDNIIAGYQALLGLTDYDWYSEAPAFSAAGGVDWRSGTTIYVNVQYVHQQILDYDPAIIYHEYEGIVTGKVQTKWLDEDLEAGADGAYNVYHNDWYAKPYVAYLFSLDFRGELGAQLFGGDPQTRFGDFNYNDFAYARFAYSF